METSSDSSTRSIFCQFANCHRIFSPENCQKCPSGKGLVLQQRIATQVWCVSGESGWVWTLTCDVVFWVDLLAAYHVWLQFHIGKIPPAHLFAFQRQGRYYVFFFWTYLTWNQQYTSSNILKPTQPLPPSKTASLDYHGLGELVVINPSLTVGSKVCSNFQLISWEKTSIS